MGAPLRHAWRKPHEENRLAWTLFLAGDCLNMFAIVDWTWGEWLIWIYPVYMIAHTLPIAVLVYREQPKESVQ